MSGKRHNRHLKLSAAYLVPEDAISVKETSAQLEAPGNALRRWVSEYEADDEDTFPETESLSRTRISKS